LLLYCVKNHIKSFSKSRKIQKLDNYTNNSNSFYVTHKDQKFKTLNNIKFHYKLNILFILSHNDEYFDERDDENEDDNENEYEEDKFEDIPSEY